MNIFQRAAKFFLGNSQAGASLWGWAIPGSWNKKILITQYVAVVYAVISAIAEDAAKIDLQVERSNKPVLTHPFLKFIAKPNPDMSQFQFLEFHFTYMKIFGECFWYLASGETSKKIKEAYFLNPALMEVVINDDERGTVKGYVLSKPDGKKETFEKNEVVHFKMPNPGNPYYGMSTITAAKTYIEMEKYASEWTRNSLYNSGRPSGIINFKGVINKEEFEQIKKQFKQEYAGVKNAGKTLLTKGADGIDYAKLGMELNELALKELKDMTRDDIMMMFRVSKTMLGISDDVNYSNAQENHAVFVQNVVKPEVDRFIDHVNAFVMPLFGGDGAMLDYVDPDLQSDKDKLAEWTVGVNVWITQNEIRKQRGLEPVKGGDVLRLPINLIEVSEPLKENKGFKKIKKKDLTPVDIYKQLLLETQLAWEERCKRLVVNEFDTQLKEILNRNPKQAFQNWLFDLDSSKARIVGSLVPFGIELMRVAAKYALDLANDTDTEFMINQRVRTFITERIVKLAKETNDASILAIEKTITEGVKEGESIPQLRNRIKEVYDFANTVRAERIARTETIAASNEGALEAYKQSPVVTGKEWSAEFDACEGCLELNGTIVGLEEDFARLGQQVGTVNVGYTDIETPPLHPNCRCALLPVAIPLE